MQAYQLRLHTVEWGGMITAGCGKKLLLRAQQTHPSVRRAMGDE
jgi:hypothetical protein